MMASFTCVRAVRLLSRSTRPSRNSVVTVSARTFANDPKDGENGKPKVNDKLDELLQSVLIKKSDKAPKIAAAKKPKKPTVKAPGVDPEVVNAAKAAAETLRGDVNENHLKLLEQLQDINRESGAVPLKKLFENMPIHEKEKKRRSRRDSARFGGLLRDDLSRMTDPDLSDSDAKLAAKYTRDPDQKYPLFKGPALGIFSAAPKESSDTTEEVTLWDKLESRELKLAATLPPRNAYEEMIAWTEQGKLWKFPIDNEQGMDEEAAAGFEEHVFLEHLIDDPEAFPEGPIREFMELVCVGLSKNPYISVGRKRRCIEWYRDYFTEQKELIRVALDIK